MMRLMLAFLLVGVLGFGGCNSYNLKYKAIPQPSGANLFADYTLLQDAVAVSVDTDGRRLEDIYVKKADGSMLRPANISYPAFGRSAMLGTGVGVGAGPVGVGTGIGVPVGPQRAHGLTSATFSQSALGSPPWEVHVKVQGIEEAAFPGIGGPPTAK